ncbi:CaiB/BaiF CoA transferase family protein [Gordonia sp. SL306]|uniref:CaiB/BaiF CoA transferase family protein n=1 Tax=Gordonia sp. SL306 TaxID=2995145 RepID=UPI00226D6CA0|nr:CaiB/BaiF CoA-transferase family protein [Gordonia sp. SL306]WAC54012.1 CaiB/BaiF CoA-transferase family protein [Gordonia sp. SL306]
MHRPMEGVRILEVAQFTFVPAAGAVLADWGADIVKIEHAEKGDAQRGLVRVLGYDLAGSSFAPIMEGPNRGKRSVGLALERAESRPVLEELVKNSDVFLTNFLPPARAKLGITLEDIRAINPDIIYVSGSGFGSEGPDADKGGYDSTAFWARGGSAFGTTPAEAERVSFMPAGAYGDNIGGMTIAGGIAAALYGRAMTGEPSELDVSLLAVGAWATQFTVNMALMRGEAMPAPSAEKRSASAGNPLSGAYRTSDGRWIQLSMLQAKRYWPEFCQAIGHDELVDDERFGTDALITQHYAEALEIFSEIIGAQPLDHWRAALKNIRGQWAVVQDSWDLGNDEALTANGRIAEMVDSEGNAQKLVANPVKFDNSPVSLTRAPGFAEHTDDVLRELGFDDDQLIALKIAGAVT